MEKEKEQKFMEKILWKSLNKLRGKVESSKYKHIFLGQIFLKFVSDTSEKISKNLKQIQILENLRDKLLTKLLSERRENKYMNELENQLKTIIQKQVSFSKLNYQIKVTVEQFPNQDFSFKKVDILCIEEKFITFENINKEIKEIIKEIEKVNRTYLVSFVFEKCDVKFLNENINIDWHINFKESIINVNAQDIKLDEIYLLSQNFYNCTFENLSVLNDVKIVHVDLNSNDIRLLQFANIEVINNGINKIDIKNSHINKIMIVDAVFKRDFTIYESKIDSIEIKNVNFESLSEFNEVTFQDNFDFKEISYKGLSLFDRCTFNTKAEFEYIIFEKFTSFRGSIFNKGLNLDFTSCEKEINFFGINGLANFESKKHTSQETYRIIKNNFEKIGNKIEANKYHALELENKGKSLEKNKWTNFSDYIVFKLHAISSKHSTNWVLSLLWIIFVGLLTVLFLHWDIVKDLFYNPNHFKLEYIGKIFNKLVKYIYIGNMDEELKNHSLILLFNKVSLGYLYYQFLTAVRKDTRK